LLDTSAGICPPVGPTASPTDGRTNGDERYSYTSCRPAPSVLLTRCVHLSFRTYRSVLSILPESTHTQQYAASATTVKFATRAHHAHHQATCQRMLAIYCRHSSRDATADDPDERRPTVRPHGDTETERERDREGEKEAYGYLSGRRLCCMVARLIVDFFWVNQFAFV